MMVCKQHADKPEAVPLVAVEHDEAKRGYDIAVKRYEVGDGTLVRDRRLAAGSTRRQ